jgi:hypothetical protein
MCRTQSLATCSKKAHLAGFSACHADDCLKPGVCRAAPNSALISPSESGHARKRNAICLNMLFAVCVTQHSSQAIMQTGFPPYGGQLYGTNYPNGPPSMPGHFGSQYGTHMPYLSSTTSSNQERMESQSISQGMPNPYLGPGPTTSSGENRDEWQPARVPRSDQHQTPDPAMFQEQAGAIRNGGPQAPRRQAQDPQWAENEKSPDGPIPAPPKAGLITIRLSNRENKHVFKVAEIRSSIQLIADLVLPEDHASAIHPGEGGFTGPYTVSLSQDLGLRLIEDGNVDLISPEDESCPVVEFQVTQVDSHGRSMTAEAIGKVFARRAEIKITRDIDENKRTIRLFFGANTEMLALMDDSRALGVHVKRITDMITSKLGRIDRVNFTQLKDSTQIPTSSWAAYVVVEQGSTIETWARQVDWAGLKYIVYRSDCNPVKVRVSNEALLGLGQRKQCCFLRPVDCKKDATGECQARNDAYKRVRFRSSVPTQPFHQEKALRRKALDLEGLAHRVMLDGDTLRIAQGHGRKCANWKAGLCLRHPGLPNGKCSRAHGTAGETAAIPCGYGDKCVLGLQNCIYSHKAPAAGETSTTADGHVAGSADGNTPVPPPTPPGTGGQSPDAAPAATAPARSFAQAAATAISSPPTQTPHVEGPQPEAMDSGS